MYLKSIEIHGFKSFANKILFEFHNGITAIVGPNGSGKSNVADAVRWVLGEQSAKQLRGSNMQDVIFSGTENRKPLSYAMVAITLDNSDHALPIDYEEVTVTRKLFRSGESEYLINGTSCRLKEIHELFYDTGIGKEGYSIIGQGQIETIINGKPEERRELFDEAAGIVKFKRRKAMTQKKLENERNNLVRINDIITEIERQIVPLEKQSEVAKEYLRQKEQLKVYDINMFLIEMDRVKGQIAELEEKLSGVTEELEEGTSELEKAKAEYADLEEKYEEKTRIIDEAKDQVSKTEVLKKQLEGQINVARERIHTIRVNEKNLEDRAAAVQAEIRIRDQQKEDLEKKKTELETRLGKARAEDLKAKEALEKKAAEAENISRGIEEKKSAIIDLMNGRASTKAKIQRYDTLIEQNQIQKSKLTQRMLLLKKDDGSQAGLKVQYDAELAEADEKLRMVQEDIKSNERTIEEIQKKLAGRDTLLEKARVDYHRENSRLETLRGITERYSGYGNSIRKVMERKNNERGIIGVVADIIQTDKKYEQAIEIALGGSIQNIVVDEENTAKEMIRYLKENRYGRATFLPLNSIRPAQKFNESGALKEPGAVGVASDLARSESRFANLVSYLLGRILIVDHIDHAIAIARKYHHRLRIVTLDGELLSPGGSMTGGAFRESNNLLSRRREIEDLEKSVAGLKTTLESAARETESMKTRRKDLYADTDKAREEERELRISRDRLSMKREAVGKRLQDIQNSYAGIQTESAKIESQIKEIVELKGALEEETKTSLETEKRYTEETENLNRQTEELNALVSQMTGDAEKIRLKASQLEQQYGFQQENIRRIEEEQRKFAEELSALGDHKDSTSDQIQEKEDEIQDLTKTIQESESIFAELREKIKESTEERERVSALREQVLARREDMTSRLADLDKEKFRLTSRLEAGEETMENQISYMWDEYEITYNYAKELQNDEIGNPAEIKKKISEIRSRIKGLGNVNVGAIEEYKTLKERYDFLKGQHDDLIKAEETLLNIIEDLDKGMRERFEEKFALIQQEFDKVFKRLFGGGKGTLEIMPDADILEAGIRIIAQPPGKKLQSIMQLSGGEKSLTAIALLFAIQNLKPSPFCLLDEIEAALDDANVKRFAEYLTLLTKNTQFIMITHRRGTMTAADRLYGITMQEKGVSALVSVDLLEDKLDK